MIGIDTIDLGPVYTLVDTPGRLGIGIHVNTNMKPVTLAFIIGQEFSIEFLETSEYHLRTFRGESQAGPLK